MPILRFGSRHYRSRVVSATLLVSVVVGEYLNMGWRLLAGIFRRGA